MSYRLQKALNIWKQLTLYIDYKEEENMKIGDNFYRLLMSYLILKLNIENDEDSRLVDKALKSIYSALQYSLKYNKV